MNLNAQEISYIVEHSGASVLLVDPELDAALAGVEARHRFVIGSESDEQLLLPDVEPAPWDPQESATATINYTSGTTARPKGVQLTHRNLWLNAAIFGWHAGVNDRDNYLHTLPMFHVNGWGMVYAVTAMGVFIATIAGLAVGGKDKGEADGEDPPMDPRDLMP